MYSEVGTNEKIKEERTFIYFLDYLEKCEKSMKFYFVLISLSLLLFLVSTADPGEHVHYTENSDECVDIEVVQGTLHDF